MKQIVRDVRNTAFPDLAHRYSRLLRSEGKVVLERDYLGENPLHYYIDRKESTITVGSNITDIKADLEKQGKVFVWERVRAVNNNTTATFDDEAFATISPNETEKLPVLQDDKDVGVDLRDLDAVGQRLKELLQKSVERRVSTIENENVGILLSGGLDSMGIAYLLSETKGKIFTAFTLKVGENNSDVVRSRKLAQDFGLDLIEVGILREGGQLRIRMQRYSSKRQLVCEKEVEGAADIKKTVFDALRISGNPKRDNALCAIAMHLMGKAVVAEGIVAVFCGEGPNEMVNDYGYNPGEFGYPTSDKGDVSFREALTFGFKKNDLQLGRGGLPKHAVARMGKIFASYGIRLEAPYFERDIAKLMTRIPHRVNYSQIKQAIMQKTFAGEKPERFIEGTSKEKFQDGSGISGIFRDYGQGRLLDVFEGIYGIRKTSYA
jgi:asparagine synthetase B (glutamine-hydrolysing)